MKTVVCVYDTDQRAEVKFREMLNFLGDNIRRASYNPMIIELKHTQYRFICSEVLSQLRGIRINQVFLDEMVTLTEEQRIFLKTRYE